MTSESDATSILWFSGRLTDSEGLITLKNVTVVGSLIVFSMSI